MAERIPAKTNTQKLREVTDSLPEFTQQYFYSGTSGKAILTRLSYALEIIRHKREILCNNIWV
jgi:hypothetical protein